MTTSYHMGLSVRGALANWKPREFRCIRHNDGSPMTTAEAKNALMDELAQGHEVVPMGECDNWDWKEGCKGHPAPGDAA